MDYYTPPPLPTKLGGILQSPCLTICPEFVSPHSSQFSLKLNTNDAYVVSQIFVFTMSPKLLHRIISNLTQQITMWCSCAILFSCDSKLYWQTYVPFSQTVSQKFVSTTSPKLLHGLISNLTQHIPISCSCAVLFRFRFQAMFTKLCPLFTKRLSGICVYHILLRLLQGLIWNLTQQIPMLIHVRYVVVPYCFVSNSKIYAPFSQIGCLDLLSSYLLSCWIDHKA